MGKIDEDDQKLTELAENIFNFKMDIKLIKEAIKSFLLANHYHKHKEREHGF